MGGKAGQKVAVGVSTVAGYTVTASTFAAAVVAYLSGDRSQDTLVVLALGAFSAVSFGVTQVGRYAQAHAQAGNATNPALAREASTLTAQRLDAAKLLGAVSAQLDDDPDPDPPAGPDPSAALDRLDLTEPKS